MATTDKKPLSKEAPTPEHHLITGFPGFIGRRLLSRLLTISPQARFSLLVEPRFAGMANSLISRYGADHSIGRGQIQIIEGDITENRLGLSKENWASLASQVRSVWHLAAVYNLEVPHQIAHEVNVTGTQNILEFADACSDLFRLNYVSTCYVAGNRTGLIKEDELDVGQKHRNHYESTKFQAEVLVQNAQREIPTTIFRPSIVVGESTTGLTEKYDGPYAIIRLVLRLPRWLPVINTGPRKPTLNIVPVDYLVNAMAALGVHPGALHQVFQLADPSPLNGQEIIPHVVALAARNQRIIKLPYWSVRGLLLIPWVRRALGLSLASADYFNQPMNFDTTNTFRLLEGTNISCPALTSYLKNLVSFVQQNSEI
jgi:thioester reductase-like protein